MRSRHVVVISFVDGGAGHGGRHRRPHRDAGRRRAGGRPASRPPGTPDRPRTPSRWSSETPPGAGDWDAEPAETSIEVFADFAPALGQAFGEARDRDELLFGFAEHSMRDDLPGHAPPGCGCGTTSPPDGWSSTARARTSPARCGPAPARATSATSPWPTSPPTSQRKMALVAAPRRAARRPLRDAAAAVGGQRPDDLPVLDDGGPRRRRGPQRLRPPGRRQPDRRAAGRAAADAAQRPDRARAWRPRRSRWSAPRRGRRRCSTTAWPTPAVNWIEDGVLTNLIRPRAWALRTTAPGHRRRRQPDPRGPDRDRHPGGDGRRHRARPAADHASGTSARSTRRPCC